MVETVEVSIPVDADVAAELMGEPKRVEMGRIVSQLLRPRSKPDQMIEVFERVSAEAARNGLTQEILDEELALHKKERRERDAGLR